MHGGISVDHDGLRRLAARLEDVTEGIVAAAPGLEHLPDAGRPTLEVEATFRELRGRIHELIELLLPLAPTIRAVADDFAVTDDGAAADLRVTGDPTR